MLEKLFLALVGITWVKGTSVIEKETKKNESGLIAPDPFWYHFHQKVDQKIDAKTDVEQT